MSLSDRQPTQRRWKPVSARCYTDISWGDRVQMTEVLYRHRRTGRVKVKNLEGAWSINQIESNA